MKLTVREFTGNADRWDAFVRSQPGWSHFHLFGWRAVMKRSLGHDSHYLEAVDAAGDLKGVLPLVRVRSRLFGDFMVSMPFLNYGGPLGDPQAVRALTEYASRIAKDVGTDLLELRGRTQLDLDLPASQRKVTVTLELPEEDSEPLWTGLKAKVRSQVRRSQKEGAETVFGIDHLDAFYRVFAHHMRDLGTPVLSRRFFDAVVEEFPRDVRVGCVYLNGEAIAAGCGFVWDGEFEMTWAASLRSHSRIAPNMLLYWAFMGRCVEEGVRTFNFGRCTPGSGTHRFKRQWGSRDEQLWWYQVHAGRRSKTPSPDDGAYSWGPKLWRKLPLPIANALGPLIVRNIP